MLKKYEDNRMRIKFEQNEVNGEMQMKHTFIEVLEGTRKILLKLDGHNWAYIELLRITCSAQQVLHGLH